MARSITTLEEPIQPEGHAMHERIRILDEIVTQLSERIELLEARTHLFHQQDHTLHAKR